MVSAHAVAQPEEVFYHANLIRMNEDRLPTADV